MIECSVTQKVQHAERARSRGVVGLDQNWSDNQLSSGGEEKKG